MPSEIEYCLRRGRGGSLDCGWGAQTHNGPTVFLVPFRKALVRMNGTQQSNQKWLDLPGVSGVGGSSVGYSTCLRHSITKSVGFESRWYLPTADLLCHTCASACLQTKPLKQSGLMEQKANSNSFILGREQEIGTCSFNQHKTNQKLTCLKCLWNFNYYNQWKTGQ